MKKQSMNGRRLFVSLIVMICLVVIGCSKYQSFDETAEGAKVLNQIRWEANLPWASGMDLTIDLPAENRLFAYGTEGSFYLGMIPLDSLGKPGEMKYIKLDNGKTLQRLDDGRLLVLEEKDDQAFITIVNQNTLTKEFSTAVKYSKTSGWFTLGDYIPINGWSQVKNYLILYHNEIKIMHFSWESEGSSYHIPYVASARYDIHLINLDNYTISSFSDITSDRLEPMANILENGKSNITNHHHLWEFQASFPGGTKESPTEAFTYFISNFFVVDSQRGLIFSLKNLKGDELYFYLNLENKSQSPIWGSAHEFAVRFPFELVVTKVDPNEKAERMKSHEIVMKDGNEDVSYKADQLKFCPGGFILAGHKKIVQDIYAEYRLIVGAKFLHESLVQAWHYMVRHSYDMESLMMDPRALNVYFPDIGSDKMFHIVGLTTDEGKNVPGFPANFLVDKNTGNKDKGKLRMVGTAVDFQRNITYVHDYKKNRILCVNIDPDAKK